MNTTCTHYREPDCYSCGAPICVYCGSDDIARSLLTSHTRWQRFVRWLGYKAGLHANHPRFTFAVCHTCDARIAAVFHRDTEGTTP